VSEVGKEKQPKKAPFAHEGGAVRRRWGLTIVINRLTFNYVGGLVLCRIKTPPEQQPSWRLSSCNGEVMSVNGCKKLPFLMLMLCLLWLVHLLMG
jgi:hypothetical protein